MNDINQPQAMFVIKRVFFGLFYSSVNINKTERVKKWKVYVTQNYIYFPSKLEM